MKPSATDILNAARILCPPSEFDTLLLHLASMPRNDIALTLNISPRTVNDRIRRARNRLEQHFHPATKEPAA